MTHHIFTTLALPPGWIDDPDPMPEPTITWPEHGLTAVIAAEKVEDRKTLFPRFQLFDISGGGFAPIIRTESCFEFLQAFTLHVARRS